MSDAPVPPSKDAPTSDWAQWCTSRLEAYEAEAPLFPLTNSVRRLAYDLCRLLEDGRVDVELMARIADAFGDLGFRERAEAFASARGAFLRSPKEIVDAALSPFDGASLDAAKAAIETTRGGVVFTAHPTFAMSRALRATFAATAERLLDGEKGIAAPEPPHAPDTDISLKGEHEDASRAIVEAQNAMREINREILGWAKARFPREWSTLVPAPLSLATWVGYDLDGRTDIHWGETLRLRLAEKAAQLARYADAAAATASGAALAARLRAAAALASEQADAFAGDLNDPAVVSPAANKLTEDDPRRLVTLDGVREELTRLISAAKDGEEKLALLVLRADMAAFGLGAARIHLRINAAQVRSAMRAEFGLEPDREFLDRSILETAVQRASKVARRRVNLASIFLEQMTARRQFMLCAEIVKHIDADAPIRFLIAELEAPATVMGAIYLARLFGVEENIDISPLFETPESIERGGRLMERLLAEEEFRAYIRRRGRIAIQLGFSDSGRFMGQVAANLAIERLQILLARALGAQGVKDIEAVIFNTHGESMGRGGYPGGLAQRFDYLLTPWARTAFEKAGVRVNAESSFQGGDGFLHFETPRLARSTVAAMLDWCFAPPASDKNDRFYKDINFSWDFYRGIKGWQEELFDDKDYQVAIGAFAPNLLFTTGSRKVRRQSGSGVSIGPRSLRAIPHNAILQQLGAPANVFGGAGTTAGSEPDRLLELVRGSARARQVIDLIRRARELTSLPVMRAYAGMFDASFWIGRAAISGPSVAKACTLIAAELAPQAVPTAMGRLANHLAADLSLLDRIFLELDGESAQAKRRANRRPLHALHAVRQGLILHGFLLVGTLPPFSPRHDVTRASILELAFELRFDALADILEEIFPAVRPSAEELKAIKEPGDDHEDAARGYPEIHWRVIAPLRRIHQAMREIGVGVAHFYGAYG